MLCCGPTCAFLLLLLPSCQETSLKSQRRSSTLAPAWGHLPGRRLCEPSASYQGVFKTFVNFGDSSARKPQTGRHLILGEHEGALSSRGSTDPGRAERETMGFRHPVSFPSLQLKSRSACENYLIGRKPVTLLEVCSLFFFFF